MGALFLTSRRLYGDDLYEIYQQPRFQNISSAHEKLSNRGTVTVRIAAGYTGPLQMQSSGEA